MRVKPLIGSYKNVADRVVALAMKEITPERDHGMATVVTVRTLTEAIQTVKRDAASRAAWIC